MEASADTTEARRKSCAPRVIVEPERLHLELGDLVLKHTKDGGYLCIGFGYGAQFLKAVDYDQRLNALIDLKETEVIAKRDHPLGNNDRFLRRLGIALSIARAGGYDAEEARDNHGRWTDGGTFGNALTALSLFDSNLGTKVLGALRMMMSRLDGAATVGNIILVPNNKNLITEGAVPDAPGIAYRYDQGAGRLTLTRDNGDGTSTVVYSDQAGADFLFRDHDGNVVARKLGNGVMLDASQVPGHESQSNDNDKLKLCPDPVSDKPGWQQYSSRSIAYQSQISGLPPGLAVNFNGVSFDGCRAENGNLLEAKGEGFVWAMVDANHWADFYKGVAEAMEQAERQNSAVEGTARIIEWHFAEEPVANYFREQFKRAGYDHIVVISTPLQKIEIGEFMRLI